MSCHLQPSPSLFARNVADDTWSKDLHLKFGRYGPILMRMFHLISTPIIQDDLLTFNLKMSETPKMLYVI
uniref:Uncharacterized protein n=1 Tax=Canis lupus dingo TaxID=286419 RepID=A0A8C0JGR6_CANLU